MKKVLSVLGIATLATTLAACGGGAETSGETDKITVHTQMSQWVLGEEKKDDSGNTYRDESTAYLKMLAEDFTAETGIEVEFVIAQSAEDVEPLLRVEDPEVDIFTEPNFSIEKFQAYAEPYYTIDECKEWYGDYCGTMINDGENVYAVSPGKIYEAAVIYNEDVIKAAGYDEIPASLEEFETMLNKIKDNGVTPVSLHRIENWPLATLRDFSSYVGGDAETFTKMLQSDAPFSETEPVGKTIKMYTEWKANGFFEPEVYTDFGVAMDSVAYGKSGMMLFGAWVVPQIQERLPEGTDSSVIKFAPAPDFGNGRYVTTKANDGYAIGKGSDNKEGARQFIEYIADNADFLATTGVIANKKGVEPVVPELYQLIDQQVEAGEVELMFAAPKTQNTLNNEAVLKEANLLADEKWAGLLYDSYDITKPEQWDNYNKQVQVQNDAYVKFRDQLGLEWQE